MLLERAGSLLFKTSLLSFCDEDLLPSESGKLCKSNQSSLRICKEVRSKKATSRHEKVRRSPAELVGQAIREQLQPLVVKTITSDNGREFAQHQSIAQHLKASFYFAHPYAAWERGLCENTNGLVRQYFPKKSDFSKITDRQLKRVVERLNKRPRKTLGYKTPNDVFFKLPLVALTT
jgi:IS30 family transposase